MPRELLAIGLEKSSWLPPDSWQVGIFMEAQMMWIVFARAPVPDMAYWPGRRWLAGLDAVTWPAIALAMLAHVPNDAGIILPMANVILGLNALMRLHTAVWINHRYQFTTWCWGRIAILLVLVGAAMKFAILWR